MLILHDGNVVILPNQDVNALLVKINKQRLRKALGLKYPTPIEHKIFNLILCRQTLGPV
jgi:hypothetical protein